MNSAANAGSLISSVSKKALTICLSKEAAILVWPRHKKAANSPFFEQI